MPFLFLRRDDIHEYKVPSKEIDNLTGSHQPKKIYIVESRSGSHNIVREPDQPLLTKSENCPTLVIFNTKKQFSLKLSAIFQNWPLRFFLLEISLAYILGLLWLNVLAIKWPHQLGHSIVPMNSLISILSICFIFILKNKWVIFEILKSFHYCERMIV